jgi:hypothetical protein
MGRLICNNHHCILTWETIHMITIRNYHVYCFPATLNSFYFATAENVSGVRTTLLSLLKIHIMNWYLPKINGAALKP